MDQPIATEARGLLRAATKASLAVSGPYAGLVLVAAAHDGSPLLLISELAEHARALRRDPACALLVDGTDGHAEVLTGPRATLVGTARVDDDPALRRRYVARHPSAARYAGFADFHLWRMEVARAHLVAGFGRIHWLEGYALDAGPALAEAEPDILSHMNQDHADALDLYATRLLGGAGAGWQMTGIDPEGCDLRLSGQVLRLGFDAPVTDAEAARRELVRLVKLARQQPN